MGLLTAYLWQRYHRIKLPPYLAFFGGRRFVPIITSFAAIAASVLMGLVYPAFNTGLTNLGEWVTNNDVTGGFVYGTLNRLLIPLGLHHILNSGRGSSSAPTTAPPVWCTATSRASWRATRPRAPS